MKKGTVPFSEFLPAALEVLAMLLFGAAATVAWSGGWRTEMFGIALSVRGTGRLMAFALAVLAMRAAVTRDHLAPGGEISDAAARVFTGALLVAGLVAWLTHLSPYVGGADSYGYVSAAQRIGNGTLIQREPLAALLPYPRAIEVATPLGYVPTARDTGSSVPAYPLGLPAIMAAASLVAGPRAPFFVAPLMGVVLVCVCCWMAYRWMRDVTLALAVGTAVTFHPLVFAYAIQPMSDVPAAACYLAAAALLFSADDRANASPLRAAVSGVVASVAFLIRPALLPGAAALAIIPLLSREKWPAHVAAFGAAMAPGVVVQATSQWYLYGHPMANGYGPANELFSLSFLADNLRSYVYWGIAVHGLIWIAGALIAVARLGTVRRRLILASPFVIAAAPYAVYRTYDHWETLRFILPLLVIATVASVIGIFATLRGLLPRVGTWIALAMTFGMIAGWLLWLDREAVFDRALSEERFARAGELVERATPADAVILASLHSGSVRFYAQRQTLDWAKIPPGQFDATVAAVKGSGRALFVMLDGDEERRQFERRHGAVISAQRWLPSGQVRDVRMFEAP